MKKKSVLHPRNKHQGHYDFDALKSTDPSLKDFVAKNKYGNDSIDFANPLAVITLNRALLKKYYGIVDWNIPQDYLCPPIPGRADYIHELADLLASSNDSVIPKGNEIQILDIGVGANCIYPIIGTQEYGWNFLGTDVNPVSIQSAEAIVKANPVLRSKVRFKHQVSSKNIFKNIIDPTDRFDATLCNPPFHASLVDAQAGTKRKWNNLGKSDPNKKAHEKQLVNFGGQGAELWCDGGEIAFTEKMIEESALFQKQCFWFSTLASREEALPKIYQFLKKAKVISFRTLEMAQGQKKSRVIAWTFLEPEEQLAWRKLKWKK